MTRIDHDLDDLGGNLAASRTVKVLRQLRSLVLMLASAMRYGTHSERVKSMSDTLHTAATMFYRFEDVEGLDAWFDPELENLRAAGISERTSIMGAQRWYVGPIRWGMRLPFPVVMFAVFVVFGVAGYLAYQASPFYAILVPIALAIMFAYKNQMAAWLKSVAEG